MSNFYTVPVPLGIFAKTVSDDELITEISRFEARNEFCKWSINGATVAYYEAMVCEWKNRYKSKVIPRKVFTRADFMHLYDDLEVEEEITVLEIEEHDVVW